MIMRVISGESNLLETCRGDLAAQRGLARNWTLQIPAAAQVWASG